MKRNPLRQVLLVTGGREYQRKDTVYGVLDEHHKRMGIRLLVQGGATGADTFAKEWARSRGVSCAIEKITKEDWAKYGRAAGPRRNQLMLDKYKPRMVVQFPGGRGTLDMLRKSFAAKCKVDMVNGEEHGKW